MICAVSRLDSTAEYGPFALLHSCILDVCLEGSIKVLSQMHSHVHVGCTQNNISPNGLKDLKRGKEQGDPQNLLLALG